jgi:hypothetical protein
MLSDSVNDAIINLLNDIEHYSKEPFSYGHEYKEQFISALANLHYILFSLDRTNGVVDMADCYKQARTEVEDIYLMTLL